jgi:hypothetical protein
MKHGGLGGWPQELSHERKGGREPVLGKANGGMILPVIGHVKYSAEIVIRAALQPSHARGPPSGRA